ncbi:hypothetical protein ACE8GQ_21250, partial [Xanthomonas euvesicatoria pv. euvesicatoria]|uniref:hypothetical protein n=1 Tax=Xanthomonas euvesicatoria TaxID=456327 RepID=UPI003B68472D
LGRATTRASHQRDNQRADDGKASFGHKNPLISESKRIGTDAWPCKAGMAASGIGPIAVDSVPGQRQYAFNE